MRLICRRMLFVMLLGRLALPVWLGSARTAAAAESGAEKKAGERKKDMASREARPRTTPAPKDDRHWYPEFPGPEKPLATLVNGGFETAEKPRPGCPPGPLGWAHPDDLCIFWTRDPMAPERGRVIMLDTDVYLNEAKKRQAEMRLAREKGTPPPKPWKKTPVLDKKKYSTVGATYGVSFYSAKFKCKPKQAYKIIFDYKGPSGGAKVWVRGWGPYRGEIRRRWETIVNCRTQGAGWCRFEQAFHPTRRPLSKKKVRYIDVTYLRVMLYAYWPRGQYLFDNLRIEEINDAEYRRLKARRAAPAEPLGANKQPRRRR